MRLTWHLAPKNPKDPTGGPKREQRRGWPKNNSNRESSERFAKPQSTRAEQTLTLFSSCTRTSFRTFLVRGLAMLLQRRNTKF